MAFAAKTWYLGWLGDMRALPVPEPDFDLTEVRYGGVHQGLSGARTVDVTGLRQKFDFTFKYLTEAEFQFMRALHQRLVRQPNYLINPMRKNLLSSQASVGVFHTMDDNGLQNVNGVLSYDYFQDYPTGLAVAGTRSPRIVSAATSPNFVVIDGGERFIPVFLNEPITYSIYMRTTSGTANVDMYVQTMDKYGSVGVGPGVVSTKTVTTAWQRFTVTHTPTTSGIFGARLGLQFATATTYNVLLAAPQCEYGSVATAWDVGGGVVKCSIDEIDVSSHRYPLLDVDVTLLEA